MVRKRTVPVAPACRIGLGPGRLRGRQLHGRPYPAREIRPFPDLSRAPARGAREGVDVVFDAVGRKTLRDSFRAARPRGLVVNFGSVSGPVDDLDPIELGEAGSLFLTRPRLADYLADARMVQRRSEALFARLLDGSLRILMGAPHTFDDVADAHRALEERRQIGKSVLRIQ